MVSIVECCVIMSGFPSFEGVLRVIVESGAVEKRSKKFEKIFRIW